MKDKRYDYSKQYRKEPAKEVEEREEAEAAAELPREEAEPKLAAIENDDHPKGIVCNCQSVRVREKPAPDGRVIQIIPSGTIVDILGKVPGWYNVKVNVAEYAYAGYIMEQFIAVD